MEDFLMGINGWVLGALFTGLTAIGLYSICSFVADLLNLWEGDEE